MSRRKQANPKPVKVEEDDAMQRTSVSVADVNSHNSSSGDGYASNKENSDLDEDPERLVIDTKVFSSPRPHISNTDISSLPNDLRASYHLDESQIVDSESKMEAIDYHNSIVSLHAMEVGSDEMLDKSRADSVSRDSDNNSMSDSMCNSEVSHNLSSTSLANMTIQETTPSSDGSSSFKTSLSKSRKKTDRIFPKPGNNGEENFVCPVCQEVLPSNHDFTCHIRSHNSPTNPSTINTCTICGKILSSQSSLDRHMLVHSGERPFECRVCKMAFTTNGNMHRHMRIHEKNLLAENGAVLPNGIVSKPRRKKKKVPPATLR